MSAALPAGWRSATLGQVATIRNGADASLVEAEDGPYPVYGSGGEFRRASRYLYEGASVLLGRKGTVDRPLLVGGPFWTVDTMYYTEINRRLILPHFLYFCALQFPFASISTATALPSVTQSDLRRLKLPLPPLDQQAVIVSALVAETAEIDAFIADQEQLIALLDERRDAFVAAAFADASAATSGVWFSERITASMPRTIRSLTIGAGGFFSDGDWIESPFITDEGVRLIQTGNVGVGVYREQGFRFVSNKTFDALRCTEVHPGDVLISRLGDPVGRSCVAPDLGTRMITSVDVAIARFGPEMDARFANYAMNSVPYKRWVATQVRGSTRDRVSRSQLGSFVLPAPSREDQERTVARLDTETASIDAAIADALEAIALSKERRAALISAGVTGRIDVTGRKQVMA